MGPGLRRGDERMSDQRFLQKLLGENDVRFVRGISGRVASAGRAATGQRQSAQNVDCFGQLLVVRRAYGFVGDRRRRRGVGGWRGPARRRLIGVLQRAWEVGFAPPLDMFEFCEPERGHDKIGI